MKIEKCPFCGKEVAEISNCKELEGCGHIEGCPVTGPYVCVVCNMFEGGCGASSGYYDSAEKAIAAWNRRVGSDTNVPTNADRIRSMSDEELATEITKNPSIPCRMCEYYNHKLGHCDARRDFVCVTAYAEALALNWLQQPVREEHHEID